MFKVQKLLKVQHSLFSCPWILILLKMCTVLPWKMWVRWISISSNTVSVLSATFSKLFWFEVLQIQEYLQLDFLKQQKSLIYVCPRITAYMFCSNTPKLLTYEALEQELKQLHWDGSQVQGFGRSTQVGRIKDYTLHPQVHTFLRHLVILLPFFSL